MPHFPPTWLKKSQHLAEFALSLARNCRLCSGGLGPVDLYCRFCWGVLETRFCQASSLRQQYLLPTYSLLRWHPSEPENSPVSDLIYALKGGRFKSIQSKLAHRFSFERSLLKPRFEDAVLIPAPPSEPQVKDHAYEWAQALSTLWGFPVLQVLEKSSDQTPQKRGSRNERFELQFTTQSQPIEKPVVFADDLVTTGATAQAAYRALGRPPQFEVWSLAARESLAASGVL